MGYEPTVAVIIPARYKSTRFPGKPLTKILGKELIIWVAELCSKAIIKSNVYIATDDDLIESVVESNGYKVIRTKTSHRTGTDRVYEASIKVNADIIINVQGDEPLLSPNDIKKVISAKIAKPHCVIKAYTKIVNAQDIHNENIPKIIFNENKDFIYESRNCIPGIKNKKGEIIYYKGVCIYAFSKSELKDFYNYGRKSILEDIEDIEILRFLEMNKKIHLVETKRGSIAVDIPTDVIKVENELRKI